MSFHSILYDVPTTALALSSDEPEYFTDLNLDQLVAAVTQDREEYDLKPYFHAPLTDVTTVQYRQHIVQDLREESVLACIASFAEQMRRMRKQLTQARKLHHRYQQERWFLDAVQTYCDAVTELSQDLTQLTVHSAGLEALRNYVATYITTDEFQSLREETQGVYTQLASVNYAVAIRGNRVTVSKYQEEPNYSIEIEETFAKFKLGQVKDYRVKYVVRPEMDHVQESVLNLVARLYPEVFLALDQFYSHHQHYHDETLRTFDREVHVYLAYLEYIKQFTLAGLSFCFPEIATEDTHTDTLARDAFDLVLAGKLVPQKAPVVCNTFSLKSPERILVITGPNQGGKTTFARMFGQLHYLASLGFPVPGSYAHLCLPDRIFTHFEREEDLATLRGKLEDELVRIHAILEQATSKSVIIMNESFSSTTLHDSLFLGTQVMQQIIDRGPRCVYVTFVDELASLGERTVSMVSTVVPENPAYRTYKIVRQAADGLAYAAALAEKYGLTYNSLEERIRGRSIAG